LKTALIKKVSNENIQPPENQKILIFCLSAHWRDILSTKIHPDVIYPPHGVNVGCGIVKCNAR
jgi:hypothetical protein